MQHFASILETHQVKKVRAIGTAALRTAQNGSEFIKKTYQLTNIQIELITGAEEALWIFRGVAQAIPKMGPSLIMDIGGGSVEFILTKENQVTWSQSFPIGVAVLKKQFHHNDPITSNEVNAIINFLEGQIGAFKIKTSTKPYSNPDWRQRNI